ncbi:nucleotidyltransferase domain-containing protein [Candidatus Woesearchaeota archaeon]|nr:nucleotidyltransferase domain-containing protein [Candidatus Woesearchaeota archaeon]
MKSKNQMFKSTKVDVLERTYDKCLVWFYANPSRRIGLTELAKLIQSSKTATKQVVEGLINENFLHREIAGKSWIIYCDPRHVYLITRKMPYHLSKIYQSGVIEAVRKAVPQARSIILFGSYRNGTDIETSDIDIAVETLDNNDLEIRQLGIIGELGYRKDVVVNIHIFSRNKIDLNLFANIANGIILDGFLEVRP